MTPSSHADPSNSRRAAASSSRHGPSASSQLSSPTPSDSRPRTFSRLRTSLENTLRTTSKMRSRAATPAGVDEEGTIVVAKGKERASAAPTDLATKERSKSSMLSKVSFRRREANAPAEPGARIEPARVERDRDKGRARAAGHTSFETPSLRQASMSSPALHLSSQAFPSPYSQPFALPSAASSSTVAALVSPTRDRFAKKGPAHGSSASISAREISAPAPLAARRDPRTTPAGDHKAAPAPKHRPPPVSTQLANA
ncbi:hypothetical protein PHLGIDRAFT_390638, partial [Phlebiopsis gigantea 11061_1 CR5-6]